MKMMGCSCLEISHLSSLYEGVQISMRLPKRQNFLKLPGAQRRFHLVPTSCEKILNGGNNLFLPQIGAERMIRPFH